MARPLEWPKLVDEHPCIEPGLTITELRGRLGCSEYLAERWCEETNYQPKTTRRLLMTDVDLLKFLKEHQYKSLAEIAQLAGVTKQRIWQLYRHFGMKKPRKNSVSNV